MFGIKKDSVQNLLKKGDAILDIFTKTQQDCIKLNAEIAGVVSSKEDEIKNLTSEVSTLNNLSAKNTKVIQKIDALLAN